MQNKRVSIPQATLNFFIDLCLKKIVSVAFSLSNYILYNKVIVDPLTQEGIIL